jgi:hypothetical protein
MTAKRQQNPSAPVLNPDGWDRYHGTYLAGRAHLDGVDALAIAMEAKWGADRLRLLVDAGLREKFDRQRYRLNEAIRDGTLVDIQTECARMTTAWRALDAAADLAGADRLDPKVWEVAMPDGTVLAIVQGNADAHRVAASGRGVAVYALEEVALLLGSHQDVLRAKRAWPGATVTAVRRSVPDPLDGIVHPTGLDSPMD